jgi:hypothetical protein
MATAQARLRRLRVKAYRENLSNNFHHFAPRRQPRRAETVAPAKTVWVFWARVYPRMKTA